MDTRNETPQRTSTETLEAQARYAVDTILCDQVAGLDTFVTPLTPNESDSDVWEYSWWYADSDGIEVESFNKREDMEAAAAKYSRENS